MLHTLLIRLLGRSWALIIYSILISLHRGHLFVWSVFAPKLLYEFFHSIAFLIQAIVYLLFAMTIMPRRFSPIDKGADLVGPSVERQPPSRQGSLTEHSHANMRPFAQYHLREQTEAYGGIQSMTNSFEPTHFKPEQPTWSDHSIGNKAAYV